MLLTADHGNSETMIDIETKMPHTSHTCNKVPLILISSQNNFVLLKSDKKNIDRYFIKVFLINIRKNEN